MEYLFSLLFIRLRAVVFKHIRHLVGAIGCSAVAFYPEVVETVGEAVGSSWFAIQFHRYSLGSITQKR